MEIIGGRYEQECPVIFGAGSIEKITDVVREFGCSKPFLVYDAGVKAAGAAERVLRILQEGGCAPVGYDDVKADPVDTDVTEAGEAARREDVDCVIGMGGGSSMDTAKMVSVMLDNPGPIRDYFLSTGKVPSHVPCILVPTSSGTGSEITRVAVVSEADTHAKGGVFASGDIAVLDPELTLTCPPAVTANSGFDAFSHALESYTSGATDPMSDMLALRAIELITANLKQACDDGSDIERRIRLMQASNFAGMAFSNTGVHFGHAFGHQLGGHFGIGHGLSCAYTLGEVARFGAEVSPQRGMDIAKAMKLCVPENATGSEIGGILADAIYDMMRYCGVPSMKEKTFDREECIGLAQEAIDTNPFYYNTPVPVSVEEFQTLIGKMWDNYQ